MKIKILISTLVGMTGVFLNSTGVIAEGGEYNLTVIEDEQTALASGITQGSSFYYITAGLLFLTLVLFTFSIYILECRKHRRRIRELRNNLGKEKQEPGWNLIKLKEKVDALENSIIEKCT